jgi:hypothetical protein
MRTLIITLSSSLAFALSVPVSAQSTDTSALRILSTPQPSSPFLQFAAQELPRKSPVPLQASEPGRSRPIDIVISTPGNSQFGHMRMNSSNALLECIVPSGLRRDDYPR